MCEKPNGWPAYQKENEPLYLHFVSDSQNYAFWIVSEKLTNAGSTPKLLKPVKIDGVCPSSWGSGSWYIYQDESYFIDSDTKLMPLS